MTEREKKAVASFRFGIIHEFVNGRKPSFGEQEKLLQARCNKKWDIPGSDRTSIGRSTILRWISLYRKSGGDVVALFPKDRKDRGVARVYDKDTCLGLIQLRKELPDLSVRLIRDKACKRGILPADAPADLSTLYRFLNSHELMKQPKSATVDRRKFEAEFPNDLWQSDVMHGPKLQVGKNRSAKVYLIAFIDDHSRLITHGKFYISESLVSFKVAFEQALLTRGLPRKLYVDNGAAYKSKQLQFTTASLGIALIHAKPYTPQGKGKIERFFKTVRTGFLPCFNGQSLDDINVAFDLWLQETYHTRCHSATKQTPFKRFTTKLECIRAAPKDLKEHFRSTLRRRVNKDRTIMVQNRLFEAPVALIGERVEVLFHESTPEEIEVKWKQKSYGFLTAVNLHVNCEIKRDTTKPSESGQLWEKTNE